MCDANRERVKVAIALAFEQWSEVWRACEDEELKTRAVRKIERSCYNEAVRTCKRDGLDRGWNEQPFIGRYSMYGARIIENVRLDAEYDHALVRRIIGGELDLDRIAELDSKLLIPAASALEREIVELRMNQKVELVVSKMYRCTKCGMSETTTREYQAACADEGSKLSITCVNCGYRWRTG